MHFGRSFDPGDIKNLRAAFETTCTILQRHGRVDEGLRNEAAMLILEMTGREGLDIEKLAVLAVTRLSATYNVLRSVALPAR